MHRPRVPKREKPDQSICTSHDPHGPVQIARDWSREKKIVIVSVDPGVINFGFRIERRNYGEPVMDVDVLAYANVSFRDSQTDPQTGTSSLYRSIKNYLRQYDAYLNDIHLVIIERQLPVNYNMVRASQRVVDFYLDRLEGRPLYPYVLEIDPRLKSKTLCPYKKMDDKQVKEWSIEKALQLSYLRRDWLSFNAIVNEKSSKCDDLADTIVHLEAFCKNRGWGTTPVPPEWDKIPPFSGWQLGQIFFRELFEMIGRSTQKLGTVTPCTVKSWLTLIKSNIHSIVESREMFDHDPNTGHLRSRQGNGMIKAAVAGSVSIRLPPTPIPALSVVPPLTNSAPAVPVTIIVGNSMT